MSILILSYNPHRRSPSGLLHLRSSTKNAKTCLISPCMLRALPVVSIFFQLPSFVKRMLSRVFVTAAWRVLLSRKEETDPWDGGQQRINFISSRVWRRRVIHFFYFHSQYRMNLIWGVTGIFCDKWKKSDTLFCISVAVLLRFREHKIFFRIFHLLLSRLPLNTNKYF
jgi:hypothetical protein